MTLQSSVASKVTVIGILVCKGGGLFCHKNQSCSKLPEMDRSEVKKFSIILGGGGLFCHKKPK